MIKKKKRHAKSAPKKTKRARAKIHKPKKHKASGLGAISAQFEKQYGNLSAKKILAKTKRERREIQKQLSEIAKKIRKISKI